MESLEHKAFFEIRGISKSFPGVKALDSVSLTVESGEVRALVGENGAGKSTLMKILNGNYRMDGGEIRIDGEPVAITSPVKAAQHGISIIFQELNLADELSVAENIFAGRLSKPGRLIRWPEIYRKAGELLDRIGFDMDPKRVVGTLSVAGKQMIEIAKALSYDARIILMDEPSATLTKTELDAMFAIIRELKQRGITVIYISHRLDEIFEICDTVTVMRDGKIIDTSGIDDISRDEIVAKMVGREVSQSFPPRQHEIGGEILRVENLRRKGLDHSVSFTLHRGEVLGIAGLVGAGRTETMRALYGADYTAGGATYIDGKPVQIRGPRDAKAAGIAFVTEDRKEEGLTIDFPVKLNITMAGLEKISRGGVLRQRAEDAVADRFIEAVRIKTPSPMQKVQNLSGGNQQKVVVAKWLNADCDILIMDEPTRGIDVGAKLEIYHLINKLVAGGKAVILISSELPEVLGMSDRVLVMKDGEIAAELSGETQTAVEVMKYAL